MQYTREGYRVRHPELEPELAVTVAVNNEPNGGNFSNGNRINEIINTK